jgi:hypothetical protein
LDLSGGFMAVTCGRLTGIDQSILLDTKGQQLGTLISHWNGWNVPDAAEIIKMWD